MFPSKNTMDYMNEMNRLFSRNNEFDIHSPMTSSSSHSFSHSIIPSSSSTETSPESCPEINQRVPEPFKQDYRSIEERPKYFELRREQLLAQRKQYLDQRLEFPDRRQEFPDQRQEFLDQRLEFPDRRSEECLQKDFCETPFVIRRQRPIIGRKIMITTETLPKIEENDTLWSLNDFEPQTPPKCNIYELFPVKNKGFEFRTPVNTTTPTYSSTPISPMSSMTISPIPMSPQSPRLVPMSPQSPRLVPMSPQSPSPLPMSPIMPQSPKSIMPQSPKPIIPQSPKPILQQSPKLVPNSLKLPKIIPVISKKSPFPQKCLFEEPPSTSQNSENVSIKICNFCRKNGETPLVFMAHSVKERIGDRYIVTCPILRRHICQTCGATGDNAHTITYCPVLRSRNNGQPLLSTTISLKNTRVKSNGRRRF